MSNHVPVLECAFALNIATLSSAAKKHSSAMLVVSDGLMTAVVVLAPAAVSLLIDGAVHYAAITSVSCLAGRSRSLLKCPRAHEGNFQSLYYCNGELACRHCHGLRYRTTLAPSATARARLARLKLLNAMGGHSGDSVPSRKRGAWRKRYRQLVFKLSHLSGAHYGALREQLGLAQVDEKQPSIEQ